MDSYDFDDDSNDDEPYSYSDDDSDDDEPYSYSLVESVREKYRARGKKNFKIIDRRDIPARMKEDAAELTSLLPVSMDEASILLRNYGWSVTKVTDAWFADEFGVREKVGLVEKPAVDDLGCVNKRFKRTCGMCFESDDVKSAGCCDHFYCKDCWSSYIISTWIINNDCPARCLGLRCPEPSCSIAVGDGIVVGALEFEDRERYQKCLVESYVELKRRTKWCPGENCDRAVEVLEEVLEEEERSLDIVCDCFARFCWNCSEEGHRPVDCETVKKWVAKNISEAESVNYILAYCKPCPNCQTQIDKNEGPMHMTCTQCRHEFCWICLGDYRTHHRACNRYGDPEEVDKKETAKEKLQKYTYYFERWDANRKSKEKALADLKVVKDEQYKKMDVPGVWLDFITKAWLQVVECRRGLQWSYAYGFYLPNDPVKKRFFEYMQGEAESRVEKLHSLTERGLIRLKEFLDSDDDGSKEKFDDFRRDLIVLTTVTGNYFEKLIRALQNGLADVGSPSSSREGAPSNWACDQCTFLNHGNARTCQMCALPDAY